MEGQYHPSVLLILASPQIIQRSPEWFAFRKAHVTASEASIVIAQGKGLRTLMNRKKYQAVNGSSFSNEFTKIGAENESKIVEKYRLMYPDVIVHDQLPIIKHQRFDFLAASLDACTNTGINVEMKTSFKTTRIHSIPKAYYDQVQLQMEVANLDMTHLVYQYINLPDQPVIVHEVHRNTDWFSEHLHKFRIFVEELRAMSPCMFDMSYLKKQTLIPSIATECATPTWSGSSVGASHDEQQKPPQPTQMKHHAFQ
ncbi:exonuclease [Feldmannia irregularis virus a]|uniref:FirrV-1-B43 n=1 Tax=Feldmannia irregularis virus a TaxID=231992 RepID=Q6XLZ3_9PHYC|nr:exonuclease [Feldmannia irregularis virus a]AAR26918.1 FirrV-1-B43 precursor [Feldmannia irregularis virus a]